MQNIATLIRTIKKPIARLFALGEAELSWALNLATGVDLSAGGDFLASYIVLISYPGYAWFTSFHYIIIYERLIYSGFVKSLIKLY